ncbi:hypothetical protein L2E82_06130 [Cichorium intybus]|uniref:Uncharacterized protein n=1 Tax=Cichorium intybus TaxID=13427 RepID=A0ACB9H941_CICIN|nr:hypothetical protein L2E82_06130 [Cichorium intybus]
MDQKGAGFSISEARGTERVRKDSNLSAEKGKGRSKQKEQKAHHIGQRHQQLKNEPATHMRLWEPTGAVAKASLHRAIVTAG